MLFQICKTLSRSFPKPSSARNALKKFNVNDTKLLSFFENFTCDSSLDDGLGRAFQWNLSKRIVEELDEWLKSNQGLVSAPQQYSKNFRERADLAKTRSPRKDRIFVEVEFRPNIEKDLVKFQIGWNAKTLGVAVLVVAIDRKTINGKYATMPEYDKVLRIVEALNPQYPLLLIGVNGKMASRNRVRWRKSKRADKRDTERRRKPGKGSK